MRFNQLPNGDLWVAKPDNPPPAPSGYVQNKNKPYYYHLVVKECDYRMILNEKLCCSQSKTILYCDYYEKQILQINCKDCEV